MNVIKLLFPHDLRAVPDPAVGHIDEIRWGPDPAAAAQNAGAARVPQGAYVCVRGWAIDAARKLPAAAVMVGAGDDAFVEARYGEPRDDIARHFETQAVLRCGFTALLPTDAIEPGERRIAVAVVDRDIAAYSFLEHHVTVTIGRAALQLAVTTPAAPAATDHSIDAIRDARSPAVPGMHAEIAFGNEILVEGWAVDSAARDVASSCYVEIDGRHFARALYGYPRPDVAHALQDERYANCGFRAVVSSAGIGLGAHTARLIVVSADGSEHARGGTLVAFTVVAAAD
jgi:hypothetical protein